MSGLLDTGTSEALTAPHRPLAYRLRPGSPDEVIGQVKVLGLDAAP